MDNPEATSPILPQLDYAPQPSVGDLALSRRDGVVTIQVRAGWRRIFRSCRVAIILGGVLIAPLGFVLFLGQTRILQSPVLIVLGISFLSTFASTFKALMFTLRGHKWVASATRLEFTGRRLTDIVSEVYPRSMIADLRVERVRLKNQMLKRRGLVIVKPDGGRILILFGTPAELEFACQSFKDALGLPPDPVGETDFAKPSKWSRIQRRVTLDGVIFTIHPPRVGIDGMLIIAVIVAAAAAIDYWIENLNSRLGETWSFSIIGAVRTLLCASIPALLLLYAKYRLRKAITLGWTGGFVHLNERSLLNPCAEKWPIDQVDSFIIEPVKPGRSNLNLKLKDGSVTPLIQNEKQHNVQLAFDLLDRAMQRHRTPLPIIT